MFFDLRNTFATRLVQAGVNLYTVKNLLGHKSISMSERYAHHNTWGDDNGSSHVKASLLGCSIAVPFVDGELLLGTWQQIIFIDFDTRGRSRKIVVQVSGMK